MHIRLCGRVSDKKIFTRPISRNKTTFYLALLRISANILNECTKKKQTIIETAGHKKLS